MNKHTSFSTSLLALVSVLLVVSCSEKPDVNSVLKENGLCDISHRVCLISSRFGNVSIDFESPPIVEEELTISINAPTGVEVQNAQIVGLNMFMGVTPILFEDPLEKSTGVTFLGSCNLPVMAWQMKVELIDTQTTDTEVISVGFYTTQ